MKNVPLRSSHGLLDDLHEVLSFWQQDAASLQVVNVHGSSNSKKQKEEDNGWITHSGRKVEDDFQRTVQRTVSIKVKHTNTPFYLTRNAPF